MSSNDSVVVKQTRAELVTGEPDAGVEVDDIFFGDIESEAKAKSTDPFTKVKRASLSKKMKSRSYRLAKKWENVEGDVGTKYADPERLDGYGMFSVMEPPYNLEYLAQLYEENATHNAAIQARVASTVGLGYHWEHTLKAKRKLEKAAAKDPNNEEAMVRARRDLQKEEEKMDQIFANFHVEEPFSESLTKVWQDVRSMGNGYLEIGRNRKGEIAYAGHVPAIHIRVRRKRDGYVQLKPTSGDAVFFRMFQDLSTPDPINSDPHPNELIHFKAYSPTNTYYGVPEAVSAIAAIIGDKFAKEYNIDYFENKAVPRYAIILKNAKLSNKARTNLIQFFKRELKGNNHGTLLIPLPPSIGNDADIKFEQLEKGAAEGSFDKYRKANRDEILLAHRVPPPKVGVYDNANMAVARDADKTFKTQVVGPDQASLSKRINRMVLEFSSLVEFEFNSIDIIDEDLRSRINDRYLRDSVLSPGEVRAELGYPAGDNDEQRLPYPTQIKQEELDHKIKMDTKQDKRDDEDHKNPDKDNTGAFPGAPDGNDNSQSGSPPKAKQDAKDQEGTPERETGTEREKGQAQDEKGESK